MSFYSLFIRQKKLAIIVVHNYKKDFSKIFYITFDYIPIDLIFLKGNKIAFHIFICRAAFCANQKLALFSLFLDH